MICIKIYRFDCPKISIVSLSMLLCKHTYVIFCNLIRVMRKSVFGVSDLSDTNRAVQPQKMARGSKSSDLESRGIVLAKKQKQRH